MGCLPKRSLASMPCRLKLLAPIARMTSSRAPSKRCRVCNNQHLPQESRLRAAFLCPVVLQRLFIATKTRQARSNPHSWNVPEGRMVQLCSIEQAVDDVLARLPAHIHLGMRSEEHTSELQSLKRHSY